MDVDLPTHGTIAYPELVALVIDDKLPAGLVAGDGISKDNVRM